MTTANDSHNQAFLDRLARIQGGGANTCGTVYEGPGPAIEQPPSRLRTMIWTALQDLLLSPLGLAAGLAAVLGARIAAQKLFAPDGMYPLDMNPPVAFMGVELALALIFMVLLMLILDLRRGLRRAAVFIGFLCAIVAEQALVDIAPGALSAHYPADMIRDAIVEL
jgi:hypothetical protein